MIYRTLLIATALVCSLATYSQNEVVNQSRIFILPPFDRAVCCIKYYEGMHGKKDYPYVGYGHKLRPGERYSSNMSYSEADALLRKDLKEFCAMFRAYGKGSLLLATLAYNVGDKICQLIIMPYPQIMPVEATELSETERGEGGHGSTGK